MEMEAERKGDGVGSEEKAGRLVVNREVDVVEESGEQGGC